VEYSFDIKEAKKYGVDEAIMLKNIKFWVMKHKANGKNCHDGQTWTYNSNEAFSELFPFWKPGQIRRVIESLIKKGVLIKGCYNKNKMDRTSWYALKDESILKSNYHLSKSTNPNDDNSSSTIYTDNKPDIKTNENESICQEILDYWNTKEIIVHSKLIR
jgi:hypothetical protein